MLCSIVKTVCISFILSIVMMCAFHYHVVWTAPFAYSQKSVMSFLYKNVNDNVHDTKLVDIISLKDGEQNVKAERVKLLLQKYYELGKPLLIKGGIKHWPAYKNWKSLDYLLNTVGSNTDIVLQTGVSEQLHKPYVNTTFQSFVDWLKKYPSLKEAMDYKEKIGATYYVAEEFDFLEKYDQLYNDMNNLTDFNLFKNNLNMVGGDSSRAGHFGFETAFWMGGAGAKTGWHYDYDYPFNVLCHIKGEKKFYIASPNQTKYLYPSKKFDPGAILSYVNFWAPSINKLHPKYKNVKYEEIRLDAGDMFFIPAGYWHAVESMSHSVSVSIRLMPKYLWIVNSIDRLWEMFLWSGWYVPSEGNLVYAKTIRLESL